MECRYPHDAQAADGSRLLRPCGQCLACRITKVSQWTLRHLMEARSAHCYGFYTFTMADGSEGLTLPARKLTKRLFDALRKKNIRDGLQIPIRYTCSFERGGTLGRPHLHALIYNCPTLPMSLGQYHIDQWPHGHLDSSPYDPTRVGYLLKYCMEDMWTGEEPEVFHSLKPGIGYYGLVHYGASLVNKYSRLPEIPKSMEIGGRYYSLDRTALGYLLFGFRMNGGTLPIRDRRAERIEQLTARSLLPQSYFEKQERDYAKAIKAVEDARSKEAARNLHIYARAIARAKARAHFAVTAEPNISFEAQTVTEL